ncbi:hypothetical protein Heal19_501308 [Lactiplantibacillus plantarum]|nr:hypothetical protein Heal19_501308 [Lactiplantibacillus plantarum]
MHGDLTSGRGHTVGDGFVGYVDHFGPVLIVKVSKLISH